jgi:hypothetical protein
MFARADIVNKRKIVDDISWLFWSQSGLKNNLWRDIGAL